MTLRPGAPAYTTVMSWKTDVTLTHDRQRHVRRQGRRVHAVHRAASRTGVPLEVAVSGKAPRAELQKRGWTIVDRRECRRQWRRIADYLRGRAASGASPRTPTSRPKRLVQPPQRRLSRARQAGGRAGHRIQPDSIRSGSGLFAFESMDEAVAGLDAIESDYRWHCEAARSDGRARVRGGEGACTFVDGCGALKRAAMIDCDPAKP